MYQEDQFVGISTSQTWKKERDYLICPVIIFFLFLSSYVNVVDPTLNKGAWTAEEDEKLLVLIEKYGEGEDLNSIIWMSCIG